MTLDEAVAAVEASWGGATHLRVDRRQAREDDMSFLVLVLDTAAGRRTADGPVLNGPRLVAKADGTVTRLTVTAAVGLAGRMALVRG